MTYLQIQSLYTPCFQGQICDSIRWLDLQGVEAICTVCPQLTSCHCSADSILSCNGTCPVLSAIVVENFQASAEWACCAGRSGGFPHVHAWNFKHYLWTSPNSPPATGRFLNRSEAFKRTFGCMLIAKTCSQNCASRVAYVCR